MDDETKTLLTRKYPLRAASDISDRQCLQRSEVQKTAKEGNIVAIEIVTTVHMASPIVNLLRMIVFAWVADNRKGRVVFGSLLKNPSRRHEPRIQRID